MTTVEADMRSTPKIVFFGAGSAVFAREIITDLLVTPGLEKVNLALVDIDEERLDLARRIVERLIAMAGRQWTVTASTHRREVMANGDFLINSIEVAGLANVRHDYDIPMKYGVDQCIGDTIGPGGIFKALRTGVDWLGILRDA
jgi:alpha-galactosidase